MWDFSDDEWIFLWLTTLISIVGIWRWYAPLLMGPGPGPYRAGQRLVLATAPLAALAVLFAVLKSCADPVNVAGHLDYEILFTAGGAALITVAGFVLPFIGVSPCADAIQRGNGAAILVICGTMCGLTLAYAGGNVGWGPTIWTTLIPAALAGAILLMVSSLLLMVGRTADAVTIDRDPATGLRIAAFQIAAGIVLGRAIAGDWEGWAGMFKDLLRLGWPALLLFGFTASFSILANPSPTRPRPSIWRLGIAPALVILALTFIYIGSLGPPPVLPVAQRQVISGARP